MTMDMQIMLEYKSFHVGEENFFLARSWINFHHSYGLLRSHHSFHV